MRGRGLRRLKLGAAALTAVLTTVLGVAAAAPASAAAPRATAAAGQPRNPGTTACEGPGNFGAQYLSAAWPGGFTGVPVYSDDPYYNGGKGGYASHCYNYVTNSSGKVVQSGMEWQCVELPNRLYLAKGWISATWHGNGNELYSTAASVGLTNKQPQGSITYLGPGDVISFNGLSGYGHAAVVGAVSGSSITLVNQNTGPSSIFSTGTLNNGSFTLNGWKGYTAVGVIHAPISPPSPTRTFRGTSRT